MLKNISNLGKTLSKSEQKTINGGSSDCGPLIPQSHCQWASVCDNPKTHTFTTTEYDSMLDRFVEYTWPCPPK